MSKWEIVAIVAGIILFLVALVLIILELAPASLNPGPSLVKSYTMNQVTSAPLKMAPAVNTNTVGNLLSVAKQYTIPNMSQPPPGDPTADQNATYVFVSELAQGSNMLLFNNAAALTQTSQVYQVQFPQASYGSITPLSVSAFNVNPNIAQSLPAGAVQKIQPYEGVVAVLDVTGTKIAFLDPATFDSTKADATTGLVQALAPKPNLVTQFLPQFLLGPNSPLNSNGQGVNIGNVIDWSGQTNAVSLSSIFIQDSATIFGVADNNKTYYRLGFTAAFNSAGSSASLNVTFTNMLTIGASVSNAPDFFDSPIMTVATASQTTQFFTLFQTAQPSINAKQGQLGRIDTLQNSVRAVPFSAGATSTFASLNAICQNSINLPESSLANLTTYPDAFYGVDNTLLYVLSIQYISS